MSGRGKGGKGLGKGGAKRHRKVLRDNIQGRVSPSPLSAVWLAVGVSSVSLAWSTRRLAVSSRSSSRMLSVMPSPTLSMLAARPWLLLMSSTLSSARDALSTASAHKRFILLAESSARCLLACTNNKPTTTGVIKHHLFGNQILHTCRM